MPKNKDLKRLTRSRMKKTGESYAAARAELVKKNKLNFEERAGTSDSAVSAKTGRTWAEWVSLLDARGARSMTHADVASFLRAEHGVSGWWSQMVTVGYERIRGLRDVGQRRSGEYAASKSMTLRIPVAKLYRAFAVARVRNRWLPGVKWTVRTAIPEKSMRLTWEDESSVELYFVDKGADKSQIAIEHRKLRTKADVAKVKAFWSERLATLREVVS